MLDLPADQTTSAIMSLSGTLSGQIDMVGDRDWFRLELAAGERVSIDMTRLGLEDPYLRIFDTAGRLLAYDDDSGDGLNAKVTLQAPHAGSYYIEAAAFDDAGAGSYNISARSLAASSPLAAITWGTQLPDNQITVFLASAGTKLDGYTSDGFNAYEKGRIMAAFDGIAAVADLIFVLTDSPDADLRLILNTNEMPDNYLARFNPPGTLHAGIGVFNGNSWDRTLGGDLEAGGAGYATILHELLHGVGLAHPHDTGGTSTIMTGVTKAFGDYGANGLNQGVFTAMSYNGGYYSGNSTSPNSPHIGFEATPMALDIAVLQQLYGANTDYAAGKNTYWLPWGNKTGTAWKALWDTGGIDTLRYDGWRDATLDLRAARLTDSPGGGGFVSSASGVQGGVTIAAGVTIENARSGSGNDRIIGNNADNRLLGNSGADRISGRQGDDTLRGGNNDDRLSGGRGSDYLAGGRGVDKVTGGADADILTGGTGRDRFDFNSVRHSDMNHTDTITDFRHNRDLIDLRDIDADDTRAGNQKFIFVGTDGFSSAGQIGVFAAGDDLWIKADRDGDGRADIAILLQDISMIDAGDFLL